eukprot:15289052-Heterocapsa_arctica.AAC.1
MGDILKASVVHYIEVVSKEDREARRMTSASRSVAACWTWASTASRTTATATATPYHIMENDCTKGDAVCENNLRKVWR